MEAITVGQYALIAFAALVAGAFNALAGGGTLITFPMLTAIGIPPVAANITNTVAMCPGYFGATAAQAPYLKGQRERMLYILPASVVGGLIGGILLLYTSEKVFAVLVPYLILMATILLAVQEPMKAWLARRAKDKESKPRSDKWAALPVGIATIYGGYFGGGLGIIIIATLGLMLDDNLTRLNALKQGVSATVNTAAALFFIFSGKVVWSAAAVMAVGALAGGALGGKFANRIKPAVLRRIIVAIGLIVAIIYFVRR